MALVAIVTCLIVFVAIAVATRQPGIPPIDSSTTNSLHALASPSLDALMVGVTTLGSAIVLAAVAGLTIYLLLTRGLRAEAAFVAVALIGGIVLTGVLKLFFARPRPALDWTKAPPEYSFPSGHAMQSVVVYLALALVIRRLWGPRAGLVAAVLAFVLTTAIGVSRIYLGVHWLTDVVGGVLAGAMWLAIVGLAFAGVALWGDSHAGPAPQELERTPPDHTSGAGDSGETTRSN